MSDVEAVLRWLGALAAVFAVGLPLSALMFGDEADGGPWFAVPVGLLAVVGPPWFISAGLGLPYSTAILVGWLIASLIAAWALSRRRGLGLLDLARRGVPAGAVLFSLLVAGIALRGFTPDITGTEKPMDAAFLASAMRADRMPPPDPWLSGWPINYYYVGYVFWASLGRIAGSSPTVTFNLAIATILACGGCAAAGAALVAVRGRLGRPGRFAAGIGAAILVMIAGNLLAPARLIADRAATVDAWWWDSAGIGWRASRIVCDGPRDAGACSWPSVETINEFPYFSVLLGDLHPHLMALPFMLLAVGGAMLLLRQPDPGRTRLLSLGACAGALYAVNSWDFPTAVGLMILAAGISALPAWRHAATRAGWLTAGAILPWLPFWLRFDPPTATDSALGPLGTVAVHAGERTSLQEFLLVFGIPATIGAAIIALALLRQAADGAVRPLPTWAMGALATLAVASLAMGAPVFFLAGALAILGLATVVFRRPDAPLDAATLLFSAGFALAALVEALFLRDVFGNRMNTLFKVYYQVWMLLGLGAAIAFGLAVDRVHRPAPRASLALATAAALAALLAYPTVATWQWIRDWNWADGGATWRGLDGLAYADERYPDEAAAIRWLSANAAPGDVLIEAAGCSYQPIGDLPFNRFSAYTGVPTVIGWANHERQWRAGQPERLAEIAQRQAEVAAYYADPSQDHGIDWLVVGRYERGDWKDLCDVAGPYQGIGDEGWPGPGWTVAFQRGETAIYRRVR